MFLLFTTTNNPTVWIPAYKESRFYALFFILYLLLGVYFVRNLILASVKGGFKAQLAKEVSVRDSMRKLLLGKAFSLLDADKRGFLHQDQCTCLFKELQKYRSLPKITLEEYDLIFHELDDSCDLEINLDEFNNLCTAIALKFRKEDQPSWFEKYPAFYHSHSSEKLKAFVRSSTFSNIITIMLMLNLVAVLIETTFDLMNNSAQKLWQEVEFFFGWVYFLEMALKVFSYGFKNYWRKGQNRFDFYITWIIVIGETATFVCPGISFLSNGEWMRYLLITRMLRLIRLLMKVQHCRVFVATFLHLIPTLMPYLGTIFCILCIYGSLGLQVFGGIVNSGNPKLKESILYRQDFLLFNFNDYPNGMVTLFTLLVGGWYTWMKGYQELTGTSWTAAYFVSFYLITVMLLFNLVVAFVLEAFNSEMNHKIQKESEDKDKESRGGRTVRHSLKPCGSRDEALVRRMVAGLIAK